MSESELRALSDTELLDHCDAVATEFTRRGIDVLRCSAYRKFRRDMHERMFSYRAYLKPLGTAR
jgi:hypothetical protein